MRGKQPEVEVRRVRPDEWRALRAVRLEALQDTPVAYCERYADAVGHPDAEWQRRAARGADGGESYLVLGWDGGVPVAMSECYLTGDGDGDGAGAGARADAGLGAVYVAPGHRGRGLLDAMVEQVVEWAARQGAGTLRLLVHETNVPAQSAYRRLGFSTTGRREPYPLDPATDEVEMARPVAPLPAPPGTGY